MLELSWFVCSILYSIVYNVIYFKFVCKDKFNFSFKFLIIIFIDSFIMYGIKYFNSKAAQPFLTITLFFITFRLSYKKNFVSSLIGTTFIFLVFCFAELLYGLFITFILKVDSLFLIDPFNYFISNIVILFITIILFHIKLLKSTISYVLKWYNQNEPKKLIILVLMALCIFCFPLYNIFINLLPNSVLWFLVLFSIAVFSFVILFFKEKTNNNRIVSEYEQLLSYVKVYERTIEEKSKNQHEYKNQLILIKGMLNKNNKKANEYIDNIICSQSDDSNLELLRKLQYLPQGGLKGLIYYKVEEMISNGIDVYIDISPKLNKPKVTKIINENLHDLSKIIGVYLDNAIEAVRNVKNKYIVIEANIEKNNIVFIFSNTYNGHIDLPRLDKEGYTTKGQGKGYGLSLVKDIINNNETFEQSRQINGPYYVQKLYIKK